MNWFYRVPIYLRYSVAIVGLIEAITGWDFMDLHLSQGIATASLGLLLLFAYLYFYQLNHPKKKDLVNADLVNAVNAVKFATLTGNKEAFHKALENYDRLVFGVKSE
jgi:hypothetical protein